MKFSETAQEVIARAETIRNYWETELPKRHPDYPLVHPVEDSGPPPPEERDLKNFLASLSEDDIFKLALIMHLGRGDFGTDHLEEHYETLKETLENPDWAVAQIMEKASLADYLIDGLAELKRSNIDVDQLAL